MPKPPKLPRIGVRKIFRAAVILMAAWYVIAQLVPRSYLRIIHLRAAFEIGGESVVLEGPLFCAQERLSLGPWAPWSASDFRPRPYWWGKVLDDGRIITMRHPRTICDGEVGATYPVVQLLDGEGPRSEDGEWFYLTRAALIAEDAPLRLSAYEVELIRNSASYLRWRLYDDDAMTPRDSIHFQRHPGRNFRIGKAAFTIPFQTNEVDIAAATQDWPVQSDRYAVLDSPACDAETGLNKPLADYLSGDYFLERIFGQVGPPEYTAWFDGTRTKKTYAPEDLRPLRKTPDGWHVEATATTPIRIDPAPASGSPQDGETLTLPDGTQARAINGGVIWDKTEGRAWEIVGPFKGCLNQQSD